MITYKLTLGTPYGSTPYQVGISSWHECRQREEKCDRECSHISAGLTAPSEIPSVRFPARNPAGRVYSGRVTRVIILWDYRLGSRVDSYLGRKGPWNT